MTETEASRSGEVVEQEATIGNEAALQATRLPATTAVYSLSPLSPIETDLVTRINAYRISQGRTRLVLDSRLVQAARTHNNLMSSRRILSHQLVGELPPFALGPSNDRYEAVGYIWNMGAENVARGYVTAAAVLNGWIASPGHKSNLLASNARDVGVAFNSVGYFWTLDLGNSFYPSMPLL